MIEYGAEEYFMAQSFLLEKNMKRRLIHKILLLVIFSAYSLSPLAISFNAQRAVLDSHNRPLPLLFTISLFLDNLISAEEDIQQEASAPCDAVIIKKKQGVLRSAEVVRVPTLIYTSVLHLFILAAHAGSSWLTGSHETAFQRF